MSLALDWRTLLAFTLPLLLYTLTLAPTIYNLDSAELTTAAATGGLVRATGYPLYLLIGRFWSEMPIGDVGYRMNLFSAVCGALTVALVERILRRWRVGFWAVLGALGLLASSTFFWALSLIAEVYTLHTALMALILLLLLRWGDNPTSGRLALIALATGLSMGHHGATVLLFPGIVWYISTVAPRRAFAPASLLMAGVAFLLGASVYLYLPLLYGSAPAFNYVGLYNEAGLFQPVDLQSVEGLWWLVSGRAFAGSMMGYRPAEWLSEVGAFGVHLWRAFFAVGIGPGLVGMILLLRRDWRLGVTLLLIFTCNALFYIGYRVVDKETMFLPTYLIWSLWLAIGLQWLLDWVRGGEVGARRWDSLTLQGGIVAAVLLAVVANWSRVDLSHDTSTRDRGERILAQAAPGALILGWWETVPVIEYLQLVEGERTDVRAINRFLIPREEMKTLILNEVEQRAVYIDAPPQELLSTLEARKEGILYRLYPRPRLPSVGPERNR